MFIITNRFSTYGPLILLIALSSTSGRAEDKASKLPLPSWVPFGQLSFENQKGQIESGIEANYLISDCLPPDRSVIPERPGPCAENITYSYFSPRIYVDLPFSGEDSTVARVDQNTPSWQIGASLAYRRVDWRVDNSIAHLEPQYSQLYWSLDGKFTANSYSYHPDGLSAKKTDWHQGFGGKSKFIYQLWNNGWLIAPQVLVGYTRNYKAADKVPVIVVPANPTGPIIGQDTIVGAPAATPVAYARLSALFLGKSNLGTGLSGIYSSSGKKGEFGMSGGASRLNVELWGYYFPVYAPANPNGSPRAITNLRFGAAPFVSALVSGDDGQPKTVVGALFELRATTTELEY